MSRRVLKDDVLQKQFERDGYCIVPMFNAAEVKQLEDIYYTNKVEEQPFIESTLKNSDAALNKHIKDVTSEILKPLADKYLLDYRIVHSGYVAKVPGKKNAMRLHQDPTLVDESKYQAINIWSPLVDVDEKNGGLWIVKGSHKFFNGFRGQPVRELEFSEIAQQVMDKFGTLLKMKAGEVVIYDAALFHYSLENSTDKVRIACTTLMVPAEAEAVYHHFNKETKMVEKYRIDDDFLTRYFCEYLPQGKVQAPLLTTTAFNGSSSVGFAEFEEKYDQYLASAKPSFKQRLLQMLGV